MPVSIIEGDCRDVLPRLAADSIDCIITSPPYNVGKAYERRADMAEYEAWIRPIVEACIRVVRPGGSVCWQVGNHVRAGVVFPLDFLFIPMLADFGISLRARIIWVFGHGLHATRRFSGRHETVLWCTKGECAPDRRAAAENMIDEFGLVWRITNVKHNHPEKTAHPCQFPGELVRRLILGTTRPGEVILDPFAGSGTVGEVARGLGRSAVLIEREPAYIEIIRDRLDGGLFARLDSAAN